MRVWKYPLAWNDTQTIMMPSGAEILHFDNQNEIPTLWALVDPSKVVDEERNFRVAGTGHELHEERFNYRYLGSAVFGSGALVFHVFEVFDF